MNIAEAVNQIYPGIDLFNTVKIVDIDGVQTIDVWDDIRPQPTQAELELASFVVVKVKKITELKLACKTVIESGFYSSALGTPHKYDSSLPQDQTNLLGAKIAGIDMNFTCTNEAGEKWERFHTAAQISQVYIAGMLHLQTAKSTLYAKLAQVNAATTIEEINGVIW